MIAKLSYLTVLVGAITKFGFMVAMTNRLGPLPAAIIVLFILMGPYAAMLLLTWVLRLQPVLSLVLFVCILAMVGLGVFSNLMEYQIFQNRDPDVPGGTNWLPFLLALAQWAFAFCLGVVLLPLSHYLHPKPENEFNCNKEPQHEPS